MVIITNVLSATNLASLMKSSLPRTDDSQIRTSHDALALLSHACMLAIGFRLIGLGEEHRIEASADSEDPQPLPKEWNLPSNNSNYAFRYAHPQSSLEYLIKISRLGSKAVINGLGIGDDKVASCDVLVRDFISESSLPYSPATQPSSPEDTSSLQAVFISPGRIADFASLLKTSVIAKLAPSLHKEGYETTPPASSSTTSQRDPERPARDPTYGETAPARPNPLADPLALPPRRPHPDVDFPPPDFEDPHQVLRPPGRSPLQQGGSRFPNIGDRDLYPQGLGPNDPFRPSGIGPLGPGMGGGGGMHPTPDDLMGMGREDRYDLQRPPGARYDPLGPGGGPRGFGGGGSGGGGFGPGGFPGDII